MIAASSDSGCPQEPQPDKTEGRSIATAADIQMIQRAIKGRWPISRKKRRQIVNELHDLATSAPQAGIRVAAANTLGMLDKVNVAAEKQTTHNHLHVHGSLGRNGGQVDDPDYIEFVAGRIASSHVEPGHAGVLGDVRAVEASPAPAAAQPTANGLGGPKANGHNGNGHNGKH